MKLNNNISNRNKSNELLKSDYAIYIITKHPLSQITKLCNELQKNKSTFKIFISEKLISRSREEIQANPFYSYFEKLPLPMGETLKENFHNFYCHIFFVSVGAVIRMIRHLITDKRKDPAILAVDDKCKFCISLLSGHIGRGNVFTKYIAEILNALPVITTASEVGKTLPVDILGRELGWRIYHSIHNVTQTAAAIVNEYPVAFVQDSGEPNFWESTLPNHVDYFSDCTTLHPKNYEAILIASDRQIYKLYPQLYAKSVLYQTKTLILGIGCDKNTSINVLEKGVLDFLDHHHLSKESLLSVCSVDLKRNEPGLVEFTKKWNLPFHTYPASVLDKTDGIENPSEIVRKYTGTRSVAEAACLQFANEMSNEQKIDKNRKPLSSCIKEEDRQTSKFQRRSICDRTLPEPLLFPKRKFSLPDAKQSMTCACARVRYPLRSEIKRSKPQNR